MRDELALVYAAFYGIEACAYLGYATWVANCDDDGCYLFGKQMQVVDTSIRIENESDGEKGIGGNALENTFAQ